MERAPNIAEVPDRGGTFPAPGHDPPSQVDILRAIMKLEPFVEKLDDATTCRICLDAMTAPCRLNCGHQFCGPCVERILSQPKPRIRCALCKQPTSKRSIRTAPIPLSSIITSIDELKRLFDLAKNHANGVLCAQDQGGEFVRPIFAVAPKQPMNDGFADLSSPSHRNGQMQNARRGDPDVIGHPASVASTPSPRSLSSTANVGSSPCALCPRGVDIEDLLERNISLGVLHTVIATGRTSPTLQVHEECALHSQGVFLRSDKLVNVQKVVSSARKTICARESCKRKGAAVRCSADGCQRFYHFVCALADECTTVNDGSFQIFCAQHRGLAPVVDDNDFEQMKVDPESIDSLTSRDECYLCGCGGQLLLCDGCDRSTHVGCSGLRSLPIGEWHCKVCSDGSGINKENAAPDGSTSSVESQEGMRTQQRKRKRLSVIARDTSARGHWSNIPCITPQPVGAPNGNDAFRNVIGNKAPHPVYKRACRGENQMVLLPTGLDGPSQDLLRLAAKRFRFTITHVYHPRVTHVLISAYGCNDIPVRTIKLCKGLAANLPIICFQWIHDAVYNGSAVCPAIDKYTHSISPSPCRKFLFEGGRFFFARLDNCTTAKEEIMDIVKIGKGSIMFTEPTVHTSTAQGTIYMVRSKGKDSDPSQHSRQRRTSDITLPPGCELISPDWILDRCMLIHQT